MSRILVTGCSGYIGRHLVPVLARMGHAVVGIDRNPAGGELTDFHLGDLNDPAVLARAVAGADMVVHLAAAKDDWGISAEQYQVDNVDATRVLLEAGRDAGVRHWLHYSTVGIYGPSNKPADETAPVRPNHPYGQSKADAEPLFVDLVARDPAASVVMVRPSVVFGPGHPPVTNVSRLIEATARGRFVMVGPGEAVKATSYIENLVAATAFLVERMEPGIAGYIYTDEPRLSTGELVAEISRRLGKAPPRWSVPLAVAAPLAKVGDVVGNVTGRNFPITSARIRKFNTGTNFTSARLRRLGFHQPVSMDEALDRTVAWHRSQA